MKNHLALNSKEIVINIYGLNISMNCKNNEHRTHIPKQVAAKFRRKSFPGQSFRVQRDTLFSWYVLRKLRSSQATLLQVQSTLRVTSSL